MARNEFSFDGVDAGVVLIDGDTAGTIEHRLKASYGARVLGAHYARHGILPDELR